MGFSVDYRSTRPVTAAEAEAIDQAAAGLCDHPNWVGCEEISFYECLEAYGEGHLSGSSKPHLEAHWVHDSSGVETRIDPIRELIDALCQISGEHQVDWEISHDYHDGPVGYIRSGLADDKLVAEIDRLLAEFEAFREGKEPWA